MLKHPTKLNVKIAGSDIYIDTDESLVVSFAQHVFGDWARDQEKVYKPNPSPRREMQATKVECCGACEAYCLGRCGRFEGPKVFFPSVSKSDCCPNFKCKPDNASSLRKIEPLVEKDFYPFGTSICMLLYKLNELIERVNEND